MKKVLIILRHVSGSGSSTFSRFLIENLACNSRYYEADMWMVENGEYEFRPEKLGYAHNSCRKCVELDMVQNIGVIIVSNTFTTQKEIKPYIDLAIKYDYKIVSLVLEKYHNNKDIHGLNEETLTRQEMKLKSSLKLR